MRRYCIMAVIAAAACAIPLPAAAQNRCPEGRTFSGECINPALAQSNRKQIIVFTQPKFSYTAPPYLPSEDHGNQIPRHHHEMFNLFTYPPVTSARPTTTVGPNQTIVPMPRP
jgi:hypothetical protein